MGESVMFQQDRLKDASANGLGTAARAPGSRKRVARLQPKIDGLRVGYAGYRQNTEAPVIEPNK